MTQKETVYVILMDEIDTDPYEGHFYSNVVGVAKSRESAWALILEQYKYEGSHKDHPRSYYNPKGWKKTISKENLYIQLDSGYNEQVQFRAIEIETDKFYEKEPSN